MVSFLIARNHTAQAFIRSLITCIGLAILLQASSFGQGKSNEIGLLLGANIVPNSTPNLSLSSGLAYEATYAHRFSADHKIGVGLEVPFVAIPSQDVQSSSPLSPRNYASIFLAPGVRLTFAPKSVISPWISLGGGYARFAESTTLVSGAPNTSKQGTNKGVLQYGGGLDFTTPFKFPLPLSLRAEIRDFYSGQPRLNVVRSGNGQHNILVAGGFVLRF